MISRHNGQRIELIEHIKQSIADILFTPVGSRVMRREYGSMIFKLLDQPFNDATRLQVMAATATAIATWEDRVQLISAKFSQIGNGKFDINLEMQLVGSSQITSLSIPLFYGAAS